MGVVSSVSSLWRPAFVRVVHVRTEHTPSPCCRMDRSMRRSCKGA